MLKEIVRNYIFSKKNNHFFDYNGKYSNSEFRKKVIFFSKNFKKIWKDKKYNKGVAIYLDRNIDYLCAILGCWLADGYYVPLSKGMLKKNINYQIKKSSVSILLKYENNKFIFKIMKKNIKNTKFVNLAYIIFTSGSTGQKKGVMICKKSFLEYLKNVKKINKIKPKSILINGELTFDITNADLAFALNNKSSLSVTEDSKNIFSLIEMMKISKSESLYCVPTTWKNLIIIAANFKSHFKHTKYILSGGEVLNLDLVQKLKKILPNAKLFNFYGPTEFCINSSFCEITNKLLKKKIILDQNNNISIGKIFSNIKYQILNKEENIGELALSGKQIMNGYVNKTKQPFKFYKNKKYYLTGDLVFENKYGQLFFVSRKKDYVKFKGFRINLNQISSTISKTLKVQCIVKIIKEKIYGFIESNKLNKKQIYTKVCKQLENYEIPACFIILKKFPTLENGKVNENKLTEKYE